MVFVRQYYAYPRDESTKTEAIIVLTGGRNRITEAGKLYNRKLADKLFISGVNKRVSLNQIERRNEISLQAESRVQLGKKAKIPSAMRKKAWNGLIRIRSNPCAW